MTFWKPDDATISVRGAPPAVKSLVNHETLTSFNGTVYFAVEVDATNNIAESDESNLFVSAASYVVPGALAISFPVSQVTEGGAPLQGTVTRNGDPTQPLVVTLTSSVADQIAMPATVTIPAGQYSHRFHVAVLVDNVADGNVSTLVTAAADGFLSASRLLEVIDIDRVTLTLSAGVTTVTEGENLLATISRLIPSGQPLLVSLATTFGSQWTAPPSVLIPANQTEVRFTIQTVDDLRSEKTETVSLTATAAGYAPLDDLLFDGTQSVFIREHGVYDSCGCTIESGFGEAVVEVIDHESPSLLLETDQAIVREGASPAGELTVRRLATSISAPLVVTLSSSNPAKLMLPITVTIPASATSVTISYSTISDDLTTGDEVITVAATAAGLTTASRPITVTDIDLPDLVVTRVELPASGLTRERVDIGWTTRHNGQTPADPWLSLASHQRISSLAPGESALVQLLLSPAADQVLGNYTGTLVIDNADVGITLPYQFTAVAMATGNISIEVVDELTFFGEGAPRVAGATVTLKDDNTGDVIAEGVTDSAGRIDFNDVTEGYYQLLVRAADHTNYRNTILVEASETLVLDQECEWVCVCIAVKPVAAARWRGPVCHAKAKVRAARSDATSMNRSENEQRHGWQRHKDERFIGTAHGLLRRLLGSSRR